MNLSTKSVKNFMAYQFADRLIKLIEELGVEKQVFARSGGVSKQSLSGYLTGDRLPNQDALANWVREYNVDGTWLLIGEGKMFRGSHQEAIPGMPEPTGVAADPIAQRLETTERLLRKSGASDEAIQRAIFTIIDSLQPASQDGKGRETGAA